MDARLDSKVLNCLLKASADNDEGRKCGYAFEQTLKDACGIEAFLLKKDNGKYETSSSNAWKRQTEKVISMLAENLEKEEGEFWVVHDPERRITDRNFTFCLPFAATKEDAKRMMAKVLSSSDDELKVLLKKQIEAAGLNGMGKDESVMLNHFRTLASVQLEVLNEGYKGHYPEVYELVSRLYAQMGHSLNIGNIASIGSGETEEGIEDIAIVPPLNYAQLWAYLETKAMIKEWTFSSRKIYCVAESLADDFVEQEGLCVPSDALRFLPHKCFAVDISKNKAFEGYFDCVLVAVAKYHGDYKVLYKAFDSNKILANTGLEMMTVFKSGEDAVLDEETLRKKYKKEIINACDAQKYAFASIIRKTPEGFAFGRKGNVAAALGLDCFRDFKSVPGRMYRKLERFLMATLFYLCCSNKTVRKNARKLNDDETTSSQRYTSGTSYVPAGEAEVEELGSDEPIFAFNEIDLNDDGEPKGSQKSKGGKGTGHKPHLVRGHFHHYRCGKGRTEVIYKYTHAYYTGTDRSRKKIVSVTTLK